MVDLTFNPNPKFSVLQMKNFIKKYHGAAIYEVSEVNQVKGTPLDFRVVAKGNLPGNGNLMVDFIEQSSTREEAIQKVEQDIDQYLSEHEISEFLNKE